MIVVDTNLIAALCFVSPRSEVAEAVWTQDGAWHAPGLWISELRNVALRYLRQGIANRKTCERALAWARRVIPATQTHTPEDRLVLELAIHSRCTAYDCEFVAIADQLDIPLLTWDNQILNAFPERAFEPETFLEATP